MTRQLNVEQDDRFGRFSVFIIALPLLEWFWLALEQPLISRYRDRGDLIFFLGQYKWPMFTVSWLLLGALSFRHFKMRWAWPFAAMVIFVVVGTLSTTVFLLDFKDGAMRVVSWWMLLMLAVVFQVPNAAPRRIEIWGKALLFSVTISSLASIPLIVSREYYVGGTRFAGLFDHPNTMALIAALGLVGAITKVLTEPTFLRRALWNCMALINGAILLATDSRSSRISCVASVVIVLATILPKKSRFRALVVVFLISVAYVGGNELRGLGSGEHTELRGIEMEDRTQIWTRQINAFLGSPFIGYGFEIPEQIYGGVPYGQGRVAAEGSYTDQLTAVGVLGTLPFVVALFYGTYRLWRVVLACSLQGFDNQVRVLAPALAMQITILIVDVAEGNLSVVGHPISLFCWVVAASAALLPPPTPPPTFEALAINQPAGAARSGNRARRWQTPTNAAAGTSI